VAPPVIVNRQDSDWIGRTIGWVLAMCAAMTLLGACVVGFGIRHAMGEELLEPTAQEYADIQKWIPQHCCWTQNCCRKVHEGALILLPENLVRVVSTGQVIRRTGWSQDANTWRCTCDNVSGKWVVHPTARTHCVFPHHNGF
jgi:hypothetical protein